MKLGIKIGVTTHRLIASEDDAGLVPFYITCVRRDGQGDQVNPLKHALVKEEADTEFISHHLDIYVMHLVISSD